MHGIEELLNYLIENLIYFSSKSKPNWNHSPLIEFLRNLLPFRLKKSHFTEWNNKGTNKFHLLCYQNIVHGCCEAISFMSPSPIKNRIDVVYL